MTSKVSVSGHGGGCGVQPGVQRYGRASPQLLQAKVQAREVLQAALLRHPAAARSCAQTACARRHVGLGLLGPGDLLVMLRSRHAAPASAWYCAAPAATLLLGFFGLAAAAAPAPTCCSAPAPTCCTPAGHLLRLRPRLAAPPRRAAVPLPRLELAI